MAGTRGFSLFESIIVLGLITFFCAAGITQALRWKEDLELKQSAVLLTEILNQARTVSISCGLPAAIDVDPDSGKVTATIRPGFSIPGRMDLAPSLNFTRIPARRIVFYSTGACAPSGSFQISNSRHTVKIVVSIMGRVRWQFV